MTARDAATEADPTDEVAPDDAGTARDAAATDDAATDAPATDAPATDDAATDAPATAEPATDDTGTPGRPHRFGRRRGGQHTPGADDADGAPTEEAAASPPRRWVARLVVVGLIVSVLFAGAMAVVYAVTRPAAVAGLSSSQQAAVDAASQAAVNLQTFRRASFDQDFANAVASLTPQFAQQQLVPRKDALKQQLTSGGRDASATALSAGLESSTSTQAVVLVVTNTTQTADDGTSTPFVFSRLQLTLQYTGGKWLVSDLKSVGLS